jgi:ABC-type lipoprotein release transport system permease subunit
MKSWLERQRYLIDFTLAALARRKGRNLVLFAVYALIIFMLASVMLFSHAIRREAAIMLDGAPEVTVQRLVMGRHDLVPLDYLATIGSIRGVKRAEGRLWGYFYDQASLANYTLMAPPSASPYRLKPGETVIGEGVARMRGVRPGGFLFLLSPTGKMFKFRVKALLDAASALVSSDLVLVSAEDFRGFYRLPAHVYTDIVLHIRNSREVDTIVNKASMKLPDARFITRRDILRTYASIFSWREGLMLTFLSAALFAFTIFVFDKASGLSGEERREIGILKAVGWETSDVLAMKFWEGALISLFAFLTGMIAAYGHVFFFDAGLLRPVLQGWAVLYPHFTLRPHVDGLQLATLFFFTVVPFTAATIIPIWRAAITDPESVMR